MKKVANESPLKFPQSFLTFELNLPHVFFH